MRLFVITTVLVLSFSAASRADTQKSLVVLAPKIESGANAAIEWQIVATLAGQLEDDGFEVRLPKEVTAKLSPDLRACNSADCAAAVKKALGVDGMIAVTVFHMDAGDSLSIAFVDASGNTYTGHANLTAQTPVEQATKTALAQAMDAQRRGPGPWLIIQGQPNGAHVALNGRSVGALPRVQLVAEPGVNHVTVQAEGYYDFDDTRNVPNDIDQELIVAVQLQPKGVVGASAQAPSAALAADSDDEADLGPSRTSLWNDVAGWSGIALGTLFLVKPVLSAANSGSCAEHVGARCTRSNQFGSTAVLHSVLGVAFATAGVSILVVRPFTIHAAVDREHVMLSASGAL